MESLKIEDQEVSQDDFFKLVDSCTNFEDFQSFIRLISNFELEKLENALTSLCDFVEKCPKELLPQVEEILLRVLCDENSTRGGRKSCYSCLKQLKIGDPNWMSFFVLVETLEEPQFHLIKPVLPRFDDLLYAVSAGNFEFSWAKVVLIRALLHSNGWIRLWALEKSCEIEATTLAKNIEFLTTWILPSLNGNDLFWRLQERGHLDQFLLGFGGLLSRIVDTSSDSGQFIQKILEAIEKLSCPVGFFFIIKALGYVKREEFMQEEDILQLGSRVLSRIAYIQFPALRIATSYLFCQFIARSIRWTPKLMSEFHCLTSYFSEEGPLFFEKIVELLAGKWKEPCQKLTKEELLKELKMGEEKPDFYKLWWKRVELAGVNLSDSLEITLTNDESTNYSILRAILYQNHSIDKIEPLLKFIEEEIGKEAVYRLVDALYIPLVRKLKPEKLQDFLKDFDQQETIMTTQRLALLSLLVKNIADSWAKSEEELNALVQVHSGTDLLSTTPNNRSGLSTKEFTVLLSKIQTSRIGLYLRLLPYSERSAVEDVEECIAQLDCASSYSVKDALLTVISRRISQVTDPSLLLRAINAAAAVVNEEKKSLNSQPAIFKLFEIGTQKPLLQNEQVEPRVKELFEEFVAMSSLSHSTALVLANILESCEEYLPPNWAKQVLDIAIFGPVPKKDNKTLYEAFKMIYSEWEKELPWSEFDKVHEIVQRTRLNGFSVAVHCCQRDPGFASSLIQEIIVESSLLDKSSSKSFGLSLAHRQKTRVVSLLNFIMETVPLQDTSSISTVFGHCIECILDPCQQFSIKLVVEWILVRICLKSPDYLEKLIGMEKTLASQRIGSVSSWINMMVHLSRASGNTKIAETLLTTILPWSSAQNFAVRCTAIAGLTFIFSALPDDLKKQYKIVESISRFNAEPAGNSRRIIENLLGDFYFGHLNMKEHLDLQTVFIELPTKTGLPEEETIPINLIQSDLLNRTTFPCRNNDPSFLAAPSLVYAALLKNASCAPDITTDPEENDQPQELSISLQKKIIIKERQKKEDCSLIVVASLIDKPNNLGGLCRTSEIFGVEKLVLADLLMANDTGFKALSMSSEKWQKMDSVRPDALLPYLEKLRADGYTVIAAEQTTDSIPFHEFRFPKKCVLLMGDEKEGVPTKLLRAVNQTVEIEQLGQTRSLNVHVTAALFIAKYAEQILY